MLIDNVTGEVFLTEPEYVEENDSDELKHYGTKRHSGRYPWGSGEDDFQRPSDFYSFVGNLERKGVSQKDIATGLDMSTTELRAYYSVAKDMRRKEMVEMAKSLSKDSKDSDGNPMTNTRIGEIIGEKYNDGKPIGESTIRSFLNADREANMNASMQTAELLMKQVDEKGMIDVGTMVDKELGVSSEKLNQALIIAEANGYVVLNGSVEQQGHPGQFTHIRVLAPAGTQKNAVYDYGNIHHITEYSSTDNGKSFRKYRYPASLDSKRVAIRYAEDGGKERDGVVEIRRGVKDLSLGTSQYAQVRILVDGTHYIKGMAVYSDGKDMPDGVDILFNSNKSRGTDKMDCLKSVKKNLEKDPNNPFGSTIMQNGQIYYDDPNGDSIDPITGNKQTLSPINKRSDQGDWEGWSKTLPSQFLSKQPRALISKQLNKSELEREREFNDIMKVTNPTVKAKLLEDFATDCDASAVELKAASIDGTRYHVILPSTTLKDNEIYAPNYEDGTQVALVRFPHGGTFEIPKLTVNNHNKECIDMIGTSATDAVCINANVASRLSGADFDGDTVLTIPTTKSDVKSTPELKGLKGFDTGSYGADSKDPVIDEYGNEHWYRNGIEFKHMSEQHKQTQMGVVSNLITDMSLQGANDDELERAVKHSMVVIDAVKHHLDYQASEKENNIQELRERYQKHKDDNKFGGASTLISRASSEVNINKRAEGKFILNQPNNPDNGNELTLINPDKKIFLDKKTNKKYTEKDKRTVYIDPETGEKLYHDTNEAYTKVNIINDKGKKELVPGYIKENDKFVRPRYALEKDEKGNIIEDVYYKNANNEFVKAEKKDVETKMSTQKAYRMQMADDASTLSSGTIQEQYYVEYANKLKSMANNARKEYLYYDSHPIPYSPTAKELYKEEYKSLEAKVERAELNAPKERAANLLAASIVKQKIENSDQEYTKEEIRKLKQNELVQARERYGAKNMRFEITEKEWEAIQHGAFTKSRLQQILRYADQDIVRKLATPRDEVQLKESDIRRIKGFAAKGETNAAIAKRLGISVSTVNKYLSGKEN